MIRTLQYRHLLFLRIDTELSSPTTMAILPHTATLRMNVLQNQAAGNASTGGPAALSAMQRSLINITIPPRSHAIICQTPIVTTRQVMNILWGVSNPETHLLLTPSTTLSLTPLRRYPHGCLTWNSQGAVLRDPDPRDTDTATATKDESRLIDVTMTIVLVAEGPTAAIAAPVTTVIGPSTQGAGLRNQSILIGVIIALGTATRR